MTKPLIGHKLDVELKASTFVYDFVQRKLVWIIAGVILLAGFITALVLSYLQIQAVRSGERLTRSLAQVVEEQTSRTLQVADLGLLLIVNRMEQLRKSGDISQHSVNSLLRAQAKELQFVSAIWILDANGNVAFESGDDASERNLSDRPFYEIYQLKPKTEFYVTSAIGNSKTAAWTVYASRPIQSRNGMLEGVIVASFDPKYFDTLWSTVDLGRDGSIAWLRRDGMPLMRSPHVEAIMGKSNPEHPLFKELLPQNPIGSYQGSSSIDGVRRLFSYRALSKESEFVVVVGQSCETVLQSWRQFAGFAALVWILASCVVLVLVVLLDRAWKRRQIDEISANALAQRLTLATDAASISVWDWDLKSGRWYATPTYHAMLGLSPEHGFENRERLLARIHPDDRQYVDAKIQAVLNKETANYEYEVQVRHGDGTFRWIYVNGRVLERDAEGTAVRMLGVIQDVTDRKHAEVALRRAKQYSEKLIASANAMIVGLDTEGRVTLFNRAAEQITAYTQTDVIGKNWFELVVPQSRFPSVHTEFERLKKQGMPLTFENPILTKDGAERFIAWQNNVVWEDESVVGTLSYGIDITQRKLAEEALRKSDALNRGILNSVSSEIAVLDNDGVILVVNESWRRFAQENGCESGVPAPNTGVGINYLDVCRASRGMCSENAAEAHEGILSVIRGEKASFTLEYPCHSPSHERWFIMSVRPFGEEGLGVVVVHVDITERRRSEAMLRENSRQLQLLSRRVLDAQETERRRVAIELHDELGQALTAIKINLQSSERFKDQSSAELTTTNIRIIEDALSQVRQMALALRPSILDDLGLVPALRWIGEQTSSRSGIEVELHASMPDYRLESDVETACFRIVQEALTNVLRHANASCVTINLHPEDGFLVLRVRDNGSGFDPLQMHVRSMAGGSIGLLGMQERATLIGGTLVINAESGQGCEVCLRCPLHRRGEM